MSDQTRTIVDPDTISSLVLRHLPDLEQGNDQKLSQDLIHPETGKLHERIIKYRCIGRRRLETTIVADLLASRGIASRHIARKLAVDRSTVERLLHGKTSTLLWEQLFIEYADELQDFEPPNPEAKFIASYCYAVDTLRSDVLTSIEQFQDGPPAMTPETLCYLWHTLQCEAWRLALRDSTQSLLDECAQYIFNRVCDARYEPTYSSPRRMSSSMLLTIHRKWGLWFRIVVLSSKDTSMFHDADLMDNFDS